MVSRSGAVPIFESQTETEETCENSEGWEGHEMKKLLPGSAPDGSCPEKKTTSRLACVISPCRIEGSKKEVFDMMTSSDIDNHDSDDVWSRNVMWWGDKDNHNSDDVWSRNVMW